jgi:hypothetical protein
MVTFGGDEIASGWELTFDEGITARGGEGTGWLTLFLPTWLR